MKCNSNCKKLIIHYKKVQFKKNRFERVLFGYMSKRLVGSMRTWDMEHLSLKGKIQTNLEYILKVYM